MAYVLCDIKFLCQSDAYPYALLKANLFVVPAEGTNRLDDLVHFPESLAVHSSAEVIKVLPDDFKHPKFSAMVLWTPAGQGCLGSSCFTRSRKSSVMQVSIKNVYLGGQALRMRMKI